MGSVIDNVRDLHCGSINVKDTRIGHEVRSYRGMGNKVGNQEGAKGSSIYWMSKPPVTKSQREGANGNVVYEVEGRWPSNVLLSVGATRILDEQSGGDASVFFKKI